MGGWHGDAPRVAVEADAVERGTIACSPTYKRWTLLRHSVGRVCRRLGVEGWVWKAGCGRLGLSATLVPLPCHNGLKQGVREGTEWTSPLTHG